MTSNIKTERKKELRRIILQMKNTRTVSKKKVF